MCKKKWLILFIPLILFLFIVYLFWKGLSINPGQLPSALVGKSVPYFSLKQVLHPKKTVSAKIFLGHVSVLNVWASWCLTCRAEQPQLLKIAKLKGFKLYGLNYKDKLDMAKSWLDNFGNPYIINIYDPKGQLGINLGVYGVPETYIIDKHGKIRYKHIGELKQKTWDEVLWPIIKKLS